MKNIQSGTPGFILTSLASKTVKSKKTKQKQWPQHNNTMQSCIVKFDYCLPPDEWNNLEGEGDLRTA